MKVCSKICPECPFRRKAAPGWLGANSPENFVALATSDSSIACHMAFDQNSENFEARESQAARCRGAITLMSNMCKLPHDPEMAALRKSVPADHKEVFSFPYQFTEYHNSAAVKSWLKSKRKAK